MSMGQVEVREEVMAEPVACVVVHEGERNGLRVRVGMVQTSDSFCLYELLANENLLA